MTALASDGNLSASYSSLAAGGLSISFLIWKNEEIIYLILESPCMKKREMGR